MVQTGEVAVTPAKGADASTLPLDSVSLAADSVDVAEHVYALEYTAPKPAEPAPLRDSGSNGVSFILMGLFILFLIVALRFRNNIKYAVAMLHNVVETKTRHNVFDDTVRETSLIVILNIMWCASAGIIGYCVFRYFNPGEAVLSQRAVGMLLGMAVAAVYSIFMWIAYGAVGWVFSDRSHAELWVKGFSASQALMTPAFFIIALIGISETSYGFGVGITAAVIFIAAKLVFIWKGYRIFFNQISSQVLFLCYLCSLEIVPLVLCYRCSVLLGEVL